MVPSRLFIAHEALEAWVADGRAEINSDDLLDRESGRRFQLREGVRFLEEVTGGEDTASLVGKVKDLEQVAAMGGEHMADSVILGENAYRVQPGFVGLPVRDAVAAQAPAQDVVAHPGPPPLPTAGRATPKAPPETDEQLQSQTLVALQKFFLTNVK
jgi:hypothetical protein